MVAGSRPARRAGLPGPETPAVLSAAAGSPAPALCPARDRRTGAGSARRRPAAAGEKEGAAGTATVQASPLLPFLLAGLPSAKARRWRRWGLEQRPDRRDPQDPTRTFHRTTTYLATSGAPPQERGDETRARPLAGGPGPPARPRRRVPRARTARAPGGQVTTDHPPGHIRERQVVMAGIAPQQSERLVHANPPLPAVGPGAPCTGCRPVGGMAQPIRQVRTRQRVPGGGVPDDEAGAGRGHDGLVVISGRRGRLSGRQPADLLPMAAAFPARPVPAAVKSAGHVTFPLVHFPSTSGFEYEQQYGSIICQLPGRLR